MLFQFHSTVNRVFQQPLSGLLRMEGNRHYSGIGRETGVGGQNLQHFMSHSPWSAEAVYRQVQEEVKAVPELTRGAVVLVDESADEKAGDASAGAAKRVCEKFRSSTIL